MKHYFYSFLILFIAVISVVIIPEITNAAEQKLLSLEIPESRPQIAGVQKVNLPPSSKNIQLPFLTARSVLVKDLFTGTVLYQKNADIPVPIASTTKVMTALVASEYFSSNSVLTVLQGALAGGSRVGLVKGENLSFRSLLYGMLLDSGNDAAFSIAENYKGGINGFVNAMNNKAQDLRLANTHFDNPAGFDSPKHYSSAADLAKISEEALKNPQLARIFATKQTNIMSVDKKYSYELHNLNKLLTQVPGVLGIKTGQTDAAKENLITLVERNGHRILTIVLGSDDRFGESTKLIEWTYANFNWID